MEDPGLNKYFVITQTEGKQYQEAGYYEKALEQYNHAFNFFMVPLELYESSVVSLKDEISLLFLLLSLVAEVKNCYTLLNEPYKALIFQKNFEEIVNTIGKYEKSLTPKEFIIYKKLIKLIELSDSDEDIFLAKCRKILLEDPSQSVKSSNDPLFIELCSNFDKCCSYKKCLLSSRGVSIIDTKKSLTQRPVQMSHVVAAIFFPPLGVYLTVGLGTQFWINLVLTFAFTWIPGVIHALWLMFNHDRS